MASRRRKRQEPIELGFVNRAIQSAHSDKQKAEREAKIAQTAALYQTAILAVLVQKLGGQVVVDQSEVEPFAHADPLETVRDPETHSLTLIAKPKPVPRRDRSESEADPEPEPAEEPVPVHRNPAPGSFGLCQRCGHDGALLPFTSTDGQSREVCPQCLLLLKQEAGR